MSVRLLIAGGEGQVGREFADIAQPNVELIRCARAELDITNTASIDAALKKYQPQALINAAAYTAVDRATSVGNVQSRLGAAHQLGVWSLRQQLPQNHVAFSARAR